LTWNGVSFHQKNNCKSKWHFTNQGGVLKKNSASLKPWSKKYGPKIQSQRNEKSLFTRLLRETHPGSSFVGPCSLILEWEQWWGVCATPLKGMIF
jgi:hypothetical protein